MSDVVIDLDLLAYSAGELIDFEAETGIALLSELVQLPTDDEGRIAASMLSGPMLLGLAWIARRREDPGYSWEQARKEFSVSDLLDALGEAEAPLAPQPNRAQRRASAKSSSRSASSTTGRPKKSAP